MFAYILKRFLLMLPTLLGVLLLTFAVIQFVPGGPVEQYMAEAKAGAGGSGAAVGETAVGGVAVGDVVERGSEVGVGVGVATSVTA